MLRTTIGWMTRSSRMDPSKKSETVNSSQSTVAQSESSDSIEVYMKYYMKPKCYRYALFINLIDCR